MRLIACTESEIQPRLLNFLKSVLLRQPRTDGPILMERGTLRQFYAQPDPRIVAVLRRVFNQFLSEITSAPHTRLLASVASLRVSSTVLGLAVAAQNALAGAKLPPWSGGPQADPVEPFTTALLTTVPPPASVCEMLLYHSILRDVTPPPEVWPQELSPSVAQLVAKSPVTALVALDGYHNPALQPLAEELLGAPARAQAPERNGPPSMWLGVLSHIVKQPDVVGWLRRQWLDLPETRHSCRNLGVILETLRRLGNCETLILDFYEAYQRCLWSESRNGRPARSVFDVMEDLLRAQGSSDAAARLNRWGNDYLLKFLPLVEIVIERKGVPRSHRNLTPNFVNAIGRLLQYGTYNHRHRIEFTPVEFPKEAGDESR